MNCVPLDPESDRDTVLLNVQTMGQGASHVYDIICYACNDIVTSKMMFGSRFNRLCV